MSADDDLDVFRPHGGSSLYMPGGLVRPSADVVSHEDDPWTHVQRAASDFVDAMSLLDLEMLLAASRLFDGTHGRHAPARGLVQQAARHDRNARGFVPGAHPAARPMHEAYRARRRGRRRR